jgi:serine phosphatase RsbU (regulator of sigma subunit)
MKSYGRIFFILFFLFSARGNSQDIAKLYADSGLQHVVQYAFYLEDTAGNLSLDQILSPAQQARFKPTGKQQLSFNITKSVFWVHFRVVTSDHAEWYIHPEPALTEDMRFYHKAGNRWIMSQSGLDYPFSIREANFNSIIFPMHLAAGDTADYYLRIRSSFPMIIVARAGTAKYFWQAQYHDSIFAGIFMGIMLVMMLYNLFLYITNHDRVYIWYVLYVFTSTLFISFTTGYVSIFPDLIRRNFVFNHVLIPALFGTFGFFFAIRFLHTKKYAPRLHKLIYALMTLVFATVVIDFFNHHLATLLIQLQGILLTILCLLLGITVYRAGYAPARYYLLGFGCYMLSLSVYILVGILKLDTTHISPSMILMTGSALETIILSFAIGDKLNLAVREKMEAVNENEKLVREQNAVLEKKVLERTQEIHLQKEIIEEKNKDILDSIHYAKRIQGALLASEQVMKEHLRDYFVFYKPKDIVSGDFYWMDETGEKELLLLAGDCTGHGVPGAFMSLLNISILNELAGNKLSNPAEILNEQRKHIIRALNPPGAEISKDGMDCVLCKFDFSNNTLQFACANNPLWIIRDGNLLEFSPDKMPVGVHEGIVGDFKLQETKLEKGDLIYLLTDGFADQFGGPKGKKFKYSQLKEKLVGISFRNMEEQQQLLEEIFTGWKGGLEQVDDVLIIGVRIW